MSSGMDILERLVRAAGIRHGVIASNIANADTPGYKSRDIRFEQALDLEIALATTAPSHISQAASATGPGEVVIMENGPWADGNNVELDVEVAKMTENALLFQAGVSLLSTKIRMFRNAIRTR